MPLTAADEARAYLMAPYLYRNSPQPSREFFLSVFSPTIHALRLHFVEFFGKFVEGGCKAFTPLKKTEPGPARDPLFPGTRTDCTPGRTEPRGPRGSS
jgi:hypothetical protein